MDTTERLHFHFSLSCIGEGNGTTKRLHFHFSLSCIGEGNGNPLQCSCLESPRDGGAWWAAVYGVAQSRTRLKRLSSGGSSSRSSAPISKGLQTVRHRKTPDRFLPQHMKVKSEREVAQLCLTCSDPMDCSLPGSSIHGIFPRHDEDLREPLVRRQGSQVSMCVARGSWLQSPSAVILEPPK